MIDAIILWSIVGLPVYLFMVDWEIDIDNITIPQVIMLRFLCGPVIWVYGLWRLLGLRGKRS